MTFSHDHALQFVELLTPISEALTEDCLALAADPTNSQAIERGLRNAQNMAGTIDLALAMRGSTTPPAIALLAHEVRNPLTAIVGLLQLLRMKPCHKLAKTGSDSARHLSRVLAGGAGSDLISFAILCQSAAESYIGLAEQKGIILALDLADDLPTCQMHSVYIRQMITNLLGNAMKFTPAGGTVLLKAARHGSSGVMFIVRDTGVGMSEELCSRLFQPYVQAPETASLGCGLGLAITHGLVLELRGRIDVSSELGVGTEFRVELPLSVVQIPVPVLSVNDDTHCPTSSAPSMLLVDDDADIRDLMGMLMEELGLHCIAVSTCAEALQWAGQRPFNVILVDGLDGAAKTLIPGLRATASSKGYKPGIIGFSGANAMDVDVDYVLPKPMPMAKLMEVLANFGVDTESLAA